MNMLTGKATANPVPSLNKLHKKGDDYVWSKMHNIANNYEVNSKGEFRNIETNNILKGEHMDKGYIRMRLKNLEGESVRIMAHILVLETFGEKRPSEEHQVNHIDLNPQNNNIENLEWVTPQENVDHKMKHMTKSEYQAQQKLMSDVGKKYGYLNGKRSAKPVARIDLETGNIVKVYSSAREAGKDGFSYKSISQVCNHYRKTHGGYGWKFV